MKLSLWLIDIIMVMSIFVPYYLFIRAGRSAQKEKGKTIKRLTGEVGIRPDPDERWGNAYIGIDPAERTLIHIQLTKPTTEVVLVHLGELSGCSLLKTYRNIKKHKIREEILTFLGIELRYKDPQKPSRILVFYDITGESGEDFEVARAEKWLKRIREHLDQFVISDIQSDTDSFPAHPAKGPYSFDSTKSAFSYPFHSRPVA